MTFNPPPGTKAKVPIAVLLRHKWYELKPRIPKLICWIFGHKVTQWIEVKEMPWQRRNQIKMPKQYAICHRCLRGVNKF